MRGTLLLDISYVYQAADRNANVPACFYTSESSRTMTQEFCSSRSIREHRFSESQDYPLDLVAELPTRNSQKLSFACTVGRELVFESDEEALYAIGNA
jgi:hypothetical protein